MTLKPHQIGDKGQRYQAEYLVHGDEWKVIGWAGTSEGAMRMCGAMMLRPGTLDTRIVDRSSSLSKEAVETRDRSNA